MLDSGSGMIFGGIGMWVLWILLIVVIVVIIKAMTGPGPGQPPQEEKPLDILNKRYARGEIDEQEYKRKKRELEG